MNIEQLPKSPTRVLEPKLHLELGGIKAYALLAANTEYEVIISAETKQFKLKARGANALKIALEKGEVEGGDTVLGRYFTLPSGSILEWTLTNRIKDVYGYGGLKLYVSCANAETVEVWEWD